MKITVEIPDIALTDILRFSGEKKIGPAVAKFLATELMMRRRRELSDEVMSGKVRIEFPHFESQQVLDQKSPGPSDSAARPLLDPVSDRSKPIRNGWTSKQPLDGVT